MVIVRTTTVPLEAIGIAGRLLREVGHLAILKLGIIVILISDKTITCSLRTSNKYQFCKAR